MSEKTNVVTVGVKGIVMFPKFEDGVQKYAIKINDETSANKLIAQIKKYLNKTATWNPETKIITISA